MGPGATVERAIADETRRPIVSPTSRAGTAVAYVYVSLSRLRLPPERAPELVVAFRSRAGLVDGRDGFVDLEVWQSERDPGEILMVSRWRDRDAFKAYMRSDDHRRSHDRIDPGLESAIRLERLEHLHQYEVVAT